MTPTASAAMSSSESRVSSRRLVAKRVHAEVACYRCVRHQTCGRLAAAFFALRRTMSAGMPNASAAVQPQIVRQLPPNALANELPSALAVVLSADAIMIAAGVEPSDACTSKLYSPSVSVSKKPSISNGEFGSRGAVFF